MAINNDIRSRYLDKVRAVEYSSTHKNELDSLSPYSYESPYSRENGEQKGDLDGSPIQPPSNLEAGAYYPSNLSVGATISSAYKAKAVKTLPTLEISTNYHSSKKVVRNTDTRAAYTATMVKYIEENGGDPASTGLFATLDPDLFTYNLRESNIKDYGMYLRKDMIYYLELLHSAVAKKIGKKKLTINSAFRSVKYNWDLYTRLINQGSASSRSYWSVHMSGCAVDIAAKGEDRAVIADAAYSLGFGGIAIGSSFVHIDIAGKATWKYSSAPEYKSPGNPGTRSYS